MNRLPYHPSTFVAPNEETYIELEAKRKLLKEMEQQIRESIDNPKPKVIEDFPTPECPHGSEGSIEPDENDPVELVPTREDVIEYFASDHGGKGLPMEYLETAPEAILFRMMELAGSSFIWWFMEVKHGEQESGTSD